MFTVTDAILGSGNVLKQVRNSSHRSGATLRAARTSGAATISELYGVKLEEVTSLTTGDVGGLLALNSGNIITSGLGVATGTVVVPYKNRANQGVFEGTSAHSQLAGANAFVIPTSIEATQDSEEGASASCEVHWLSTNGTAVAVTGSAGNTLASEAFAVEYDLGPADINGTDITSVTGVTVTPGLTVVKKGQYGRARPVIASIKMTDPTIDITVHDIDEVATLTGGFTTLTSFECYFVKRDDGGEQVADATAEHVKISFAAGIAHAETIETSDSSDGSVTVRLTGKALAVSTASAIT